MTVETTVNLGLLVMAALTSIVIILSLSGNDTLITIAAIIIVIQIVGGGIFIGRLKDRVGRESREDYNGN